ncbi:glycoside hydrolase family 97 protein [candidate division KSB1 bacterium]|nr:glycoside hydrolase family 97 protein [candidate division KSB1 bacterium]
MLSSIKHIMIILLLSVTIQSLNAKEIEQLQSPDKKIIVKVGLKQLSGKKSCCYSIQFQDKNVLIESPIALDFKDAPSFEKNLKIAQVNRNTINETWQRVWGKRKNVLNHCNELKLEFVEKNAPHLQINFIFRAYNDGVAFRYEFPENSNWGSFELSAERTEFRFPGLPIVWAVNFGGFHSSQESEFNQMQMSDLSPTELYGCPLLVNVEPFVWAAITEANLTDWAGMHFTRVKDQPNTVITKLAPHPEQMDIAVRSTAPRFSPWRVIMIADQPGKFIESDIIQNLNDPLAIDASWIKPGKSAWDRWWSGSYAPDVDFEIGMNTATMKYFVDLAAEMNWQYQLVDWYWYGPPFADGAIETTWAVNPDANITTVVPELDLPELIQYANARDIKLILWLHWGSVDKQMDVAFPLYEKWGIAGVKIDFMDRDDQEMVNFYHRVVKKAAEHHLMVDFHGAYKPTGWSRTYPNFITREGVLGNEYTKWSDRVTPDHCLTIPFTRGLLGEMDFTPGGFRQKTKDTFRIVGGDSPGPFVMGTRTYQLAMLVVYESALTILCDSPYNYRSSPAGTDFLKIVPTTWDDTKVIHGKVGDYITVARRSGNEWYIASMTDWDARTLEIPLNFLDSGKYNAEIWADAYEANEYPDRLMKRKLVVSASDTLKAVMTSGGGHIIRLVPVN